MLAALVSPCIGKWMEDVTVYGAPEMARKTLNSTGHHVQAVMQVPYLEYVARNQQCHKRLCMPPRESCSEPNAPGSETLWQSNKTVPNVLRCRLAHPGRKASQSVIGRPSPMVLCLAGSTP